VHLVVLQLIALAAVAVGSCAAHSTQPSELAPTDALIQSLEEQGATVARAGSLAPSAYPFFSVSAQRIVVNSADVQVFEYASPERADSDASKVSPTGTPIGQSQISWMDVPHFYKRNRLVVLYVGHSADILRLLQVVLGPPFAAGG
jgi:hypothetical protein